MLNLFNTINFLSGTHIILVYNCKYYTFIFDLYIKFFIVFIIVL